MIISGYKLSYADKKLVLLIQGSPGVGKSTLAQSASTKVITIDTDVGMSRVKPEHRKDVSSCQTFEEIKADVEAAKGAYDTIVIDTGGALVEMMKDYIIDHPDEFKGGTQTTGGLSQKGYGYVKRLWNDFSRELRKNFNVIYIFHENAKSAGDDGTFYEIVCEGSARVTVYQSCDLAARLFIKSGQRYLGFTPTEQYSAKSCYGVKGLLQVPELKDGDTNDFLAKLFAKVRENIAAEENALAPQKSKYDIAMADAAKIVATVATPDDVQEAVDGIRNLDHALTSEKEAKAMLKKRMDELGIVYDKATKTYAYKA